MATKIKTIYGVDIFVDGDGVFRATVDGRPRTSKQLKLLETQIRKAFQGVQIITLHSHGDLPHEPSVEKVIKADSHSLYGPGERRIWGREYQYDEGVLDVLRSVNEEYKLARADFEARWEKRWTDAKSELTPVNYQQIRDELRRRMNGE